MNVLEAGETAKSYFDEIKDPAGLMDDLEAWLGGIDRMILEKGAVQGKSRLQTSTFRAVARERAPVQKQIQPGAHHEIHRADRREQNLPARKFLEQEFANEVAFSHVECRESWKPTTRDNRTRAKRTALMDICRAVGVRLDEQTKAKRNAGH